jgi:hypothetical protein
MVMLKTFYAMRFRNWLRLLPSICWIVAFVVVNFAVRPSGGGNPYSRLATMNAMNEDHSFSINRYIYLTNDWARNPDGSYYSNKAPGPMLLGYPIYRIVDRFYIGTITPRPQRDLTRFAHKDDTLFAVSIIIQVFPFALIVLLLCRLLLDLGFSPGNVSFSAAGLCFAHTGSLYMNTFFGHGMACVFTLVVLYSWLRRKGLACGLGILVDYGSIFIAAAYLLLLLIDFFRDKPPLPLRQKSLCRSLLLLLAGGLFPFYLWCYYHLRAFGGIFAIAAKFQNPMFTYLAGEKVNLWGALTVPQAWILQELLFGSARGILVSMPWVFTVCGGAVVRLIQMMGREETDGSPERRRSFLGIFAFSVTGLILLLMMNAGFGGWHGGYNVGPRYLSAGIVSFPLLLPFLLKGRGRIFSLLHLSLLLVSAAVFVLAYGVELLIPPVPMWPYYLDQVVHLNPPTVARIFLIITVFAMAAACSYLVSGRKPHFSELLRD